MHTFTSLQQANSVIVHCSSFIFVIPYASADAKMHRNRGRWRRGPMQWHNWHYGYAFTCTTAHSHMAVIWTIFCWDQPTKSSKLAIPTTLALTVQAVSHGCYSVLLFLVLFQALTAESLLSMENVIPANHRRAYVNTILLIHSAVAATRIGASTATKVVTISVLLF